MCGRFNLFANKQELIERFQLVNGVDFDLSERYNIAPSQDVFTVVKGKDGNRGGFLRWGLIPSWANDAKIGYKMINARAETVDKKPSFKNLLLRRRCFIIANGFYEWKKIGDEKQPYHMRQKNKEPFAFAGLWDRWENNGQMIQSCTMITTEPNKLVQPIHDRMPVILTKEAERIWLDPSVEDPVQLKRLLVPFPSAKMEAYPISSAVNNPQQDFKGIIDKLD